MIVNLEEIRGGAQRAGDDPLIPGADSLQLQPHVRRQLVAAAPAERIVQRFRVAAARTALPLRQPLDLLFRQHPGLPPIPTLRKKKRPAETPAFCAASFVKGEDSTDCCAVGK